MAHQKMSSAAVKSSQLMELFEDQIKDVYWAEKALTKAIPKMVKKATSQKLIKALNMHLEETNEQLERLEEVFASIDREPVEKKCYAMEGILKEAEETMESSDVGPMCDAAIILSGQRVEHYEIASYGTLLTFAKTLGLDDTTDLLKQTLKEEKEIDAKLSEIAALINMDAANNKEA